VGKGPRRQLAWLRVFEDSKKGKDPLKKGSEKGSVNANADKGIYIELE